MGKYEVVETSLKEKGNSGSEDTRRGSSSNVSETMVFSQSHNDLGTSSNELNDLRTGIEDEKWYMLDGTPVEKESLQPVYSLHHAVELQLELLLKMLKEGCETLEGCETAQTEEELGLLMSSTQKQLLAIKNLNHEIQLVLNLLVDPCGNESVGMWNQNNCTSNSTSPALQFPILHQLSQFSGSSAEVVIEQNLGSVNENDISGDFLSQINNLVDTFSMKDQAQSGEAVIVNGAPFQIVTLVPNHVHRPGDRQSLPQWQQFAMNQGGFNQQADLLQQQGALYQLQGGVQQSGFQQGQVVLQQQQAGIHQHQAGFQQVQIGLQEHGLQHGQGVLHQQQAIHMAHVSPENEATGQRVPEATIAYNGQLCEGYHRLMMTPPLPVPVQTEKKLSQESLVKLQ